MVANIVPNQRIITVSKAECSKKELYTMNNLKAIDKAAIDLQSKGGFKLYIYLAKNQNNYSFNLSSKHFLEWSGLGYTAYTTAFNELIEKGYLVKSNKSIGDNNKYTFYDIPKE